MSNRIVSQEFVFFPNAAIKMGCKCVAWATQWAFASLQFAILFGIFLLMAVFRMLFLIPVGPDWMLAASFIRARGTLVLARQMDRASDLLGEELVHISDDLFDNCFVGPFAPAVVSSAEVKTMAEAGVF
ncbi:MAG: hypothetical protein ACK5N9_21110, partial [Pirellula sp.]